MSAALEHETIKPEGVALLGNLGTGSAGVTPDGVVITPGLRIASAVASVGMGDSFTAGVLALL